MIRIIVEGDNIKEVHELLDRINGYDSETTADIIDDLAGDVNTLRGDVRKIELTQVDPVKMFNDIWDKIDGKKDKKK